MSIAAIGAVTQATQTAQVVQASVAAAQQQSQNAMLQQDTASISEAGRASLAHDGDGDGH